MYKHFTFEERKTLKRLFENRLPIETIAEKLDRNPVTIYRELHRGFVGLDESGRPIYDHKKAQRDYEVRKRANTRFKWKVEGEGRD